MLSLAAVLCSGAFIQAEGPVNQYLLGFWQIPDFRFNPLVGLLVESRHTVNDSWMGLDHIARH
jgi:hypothetical protein